MQIIVRDSSPLLSARIGEIPKNFNAKSSGIKNSVEGSQYIEPNARNINLKNLNDFIVKINTSQSYNDLPDIIRFDYNLLENTGVDPRELSTVVKFSYQLAATKFNLKVKDVKLSGVCHRPISYKFKEELEKNNFVGGIMTAHATSLDETKYYREVWAKDNGFWDKRSYANKIIIEKKPLDFKLTFRQEQILQLIKTRGLSNGQIANMLNISESTVKMHVGLILKKYGFKTRMQLVTNMY